MVDIGVAHTQVMPARVGAVDAASHGSDDPAFDGTRIGVGAPVVGRTAVLGRDGEAVPGVGGGVAVAGGEEGCDGERGERDRCRGAGLVSGHGDACGGRFDSNDPRCLIDGSILSGHAGIADAAWRRGAELSGAGCRRGWGHGPGDQLAPRLPVQPEPCVKPVAQPFRIGEGQRYDRRGDVAVHPLEDDADLLRLVGQLVGRREGEHRLVGKLMRGHRRCPCCGGAGPPA